MIHANEPAATVLEEMSSRASALLRQR
jgi:hypothetical protein